MTLTRGNTALKKETMRGYIHTSEKERVITKISTLLEGTVYGGKQS